MKYPEVVSIRGELLLKRVIYLGNHRYPGQNLLLNPISGDIWLSQSLQNATLKYGSYAEGLVSSQSIHLGDLEEGPGTPSSQQLKLLLFKQVLIFSLSNHLIFEMTLNSTRL